MFFRLDHYNTRSVGIDDVEEALIGELTKFERFLCQTQELIDVVNKVILHSFTLVYTYCM